MPRMNCPARDGRSEEALAYVDALDLPACLVFTDQQPPRPLTLPTTGHGPCADCIPPRPSLWARIRARLRQVG